VTLKQLPNKIAAAPRKLSFLPSAGGANASHYLTPEHKAWRRAVLERDRFTCQAVGCGANGPGIRLFADHVVEIQDGGAKLDVNNGMCLCSACHAAKTAKCRKERLSKSL